MVGLHIRSVGWDRKGALHDDIVASGFLLHYRWIWQLVDLDGLAIGLTLRSKGGGSCNVLGSSNVVGYSVTCCISP